MVGDTTTATSLVMELEARTLSAADLGLAAGWGRSFLVEPPARLSVLGDPARLAGRPADGPGATLGLFCSVRCPGERILWAYDLAQRWRREETIVISGFHSPVEKECLRILLRGPQPVILCPARGLAGFRVPTDWRRAVIEGRLLLLSAFDPGERRATAELARRRNALVAALADRLCFIHVTPGGELESLREQARAAGKAEVALEGP